ncbi:MAG: hypothetical protein V4642_15145 [Bacteroidota bacterium]
MRRLLIVLLLIVSSFPLAFSKGKDSLGVVRTEDFHYSLKTPEKWVSDTKSGLEGGLPLIFLPKGKTWESSPVVLYTYVQPLDSAVEHFRIINDDSRRMSISVSKLSAKHLEPSAIGEHRVQVVHFISEPGKIFDAVAYISQTPTLIVRVVMSAKTLDDFKKNLPVFEKSLQSYNFTAEQK